LPEPTLTLFDLDHEMIDAFERVSLDSDLTISITSTQASDVHDESVAGILPPPLIRGADAVARLQRVRNRLLGSPLIALADPSCVPVDPLARLGFHTVIRSAGTPDQTARRCLDAALAARRATDLDLVGGSAAMAELRREIRVAAEVKTHVLLLGETGAGKSAAARAIHALSPRRDEPFETIDCSALAPSLVESELFGHERGAFTGAHERRLGRLERAAEGTLLLDEVGELDRPLQAKLLSALEERRFERLGGSRVLAFRARVVAATNRDLEAEVRAGRFRRDLFYRLNVLRLHVPPLRERRHDFPVLVDHLLRRAARRHGRPPLQPSAELVARLIEEEWPGNIRELANRLEAMTVRGSNEPTPTRPPASGGPGEDREQAQRRQLARLLRECGGNVARVARRLGRPRSTVRAQIARNGLQHLIPRD